MTKIIQSVWRSAVNGAWTTAADWDPSTVPNFGAGNVYDVTIGGSATSGTALFTVTSSASEIVDFLDVNANATLDIAAGIFTVDSKVEPYSNTYNYGTIDVAAAATLTYGLAGSPSADSGEIFNLGTVNLAGKLAIAAPYFALQGKGKVTLTGGSIVASNGSATAQLVNAGNVIAGSGAIGGGTALNLVNGPLGIIDANAAAALVINTVSVPSENAGTIETTGSGGLAIDSNMQLDGKLVAAGAGAMTVAANADVAGGGDVDVSAGGTITLDQGQIGVGGVISIAAKTAKTAAGKIETTVGNTIGVTANNSYAGDVLSAGDVADAGAIIVANDSTLNLNASVYGAGAIDLEGSGGPTKLEIFGNGASLYQTGGVDLGDRLEDSIVGNGFGASLSDNAKIYGAGTIGDTWLRLDIHATGSVDADLGVGLGLTIVADTAAVKAGTESEDYNDGTIETTGAGGLTISGGTLDSAGTIEASGSAPLTLKDVQIDNGGGIIETIGAGSIILDDNSEIYNQYYVMISTGGTLSTTAGDKSDAIFNNLSSSGTIKVMGNSTLSVNSHWLNTGAIDLEGASAAAKILIDANSSWELLGTGKINLIGASSTILSGGAGAELENKSETIIGSGVIGDANMTVNNELDGIIDATGATGLKLDATAYNGSTTFMYNAGTIESNSAGGLTIESAIYSPGKLIANTGGDIVAQDAVYGPGLATINGTGSIEFGAEVDNSVDFAAHAAGSLILNDSTLFYGSLTGWAKGDSVDLRDFAFKAGATEIDSPKSSFGALDAGLVVTNGTSLSTSLYLIGDYVPAFLSSEHLAFQFSSDGHEIGTSGADGTLIKLVSTA